jgi:hypothetical protein
MPYPMNVHKELKSTFTSYWEYLALRAACQLDLFDLIESTKYDLDGLAKATESDPSALKLLLDALLSLGTISREAEVYRLMEKGALLTVNHPHSLKQAAILWGEEHLTAWQNLASTIKTGNPAFEQVYEKPFFEYIAADAEKLCNYHFAMSEYARDDYKELGSKLDFSGHKAIMDVGGGLGTLLKAIEPFCLDSKLLLFDLEEVISLGGKIPKIESVSGDFLESIPSIADAIILARVLHDWPDEKALTILKNCWKALSEGDSIYIVENMKEFYQDSMSLLTLNMAVMCDSYERTSAQYIILLEKAGFSCLNSTRINDLQWVITAKK